VGDKAVTRGTSRVATAALRPYLPRDATLLADLFRDSVEGLMAEDYSADQQAAWAAAADEPGFVKELETLLTLVVEVDGKPAGFAAMRDNEVIVHLYVSPRHARQGLGTHLCDALERLAVARGSKLMSVDASDNATDFFALRGYEPRQRNTVQRGDEWLTTTTMGKPLAAPKPEVLQ
jgi:putative acetyltransferase